MGLPPLQKPPGLHPVGPRVRCSRRALDHPARPPVTSKERARAAVTADDDGRLPRATDHLTPKPWALSQLEAHTDIAGTRPPPPPAAEHRTWRTTSYRASGSSTMSGRSPPCPQRSSPPSRSPPPAATTRPESASTAGIAMIGVDLTLDADHRGVRRHRRCECLVRSVSGPVSAAGYRRVADWMQHKLRAVESQARQAGSQAPVKEVTLPGEHHRPPG